MNQVSNNVFLNNSLFNHAQVEQIETTKVHNIDCNHGQQQLQTTQLINDELQLDNNFSSQLQLDNHHLNNHRNFR